MPSRTGPVLILGDQALAAAMIGMLVELAGWQPRFATPGEQPSDALTRVRPLAAVLIDVRLEAARSDLLVALAARRRVGVAIFGPAEQRQAVACLARSRRLPWFTTSSDIEHVALVLRAAAEQEWWGRGSDRRRSPVVRTDDGTVAFDDSNGVRWTMVDRRMGDDRRGAGTPLAPGEPLTGLPSNAVTAGVERVFLSASGERLRYEPGPNEVADLTADVLEVQLSRALPM